MEKLNLLKWYEDRYSQIEAKRTIYKYLTGKGICIGGKKKKLKNMVNECLKEFGIKRSECHMQRLHDAYTAILKTPHRQEIPKQKNPSIFVADTKADAKIVVLEDITNKSTDAVLNVPVFSKSRNKKKNRNKNKHPYWVEFSNDFYSSEVWRIVRYQALKLHGGSCQCCGARPTPGHPLHVDHVKPRSKYPELALELSNLQILCEDCNLGKLAWDETDWRNK